MEHIIVERRFSEPVEIESIHAMEGKESGSLQDHDVSFVRSYFSSDRKRMICVYEAPNAESVRLASQRAGLPFERIWSARGFRMSE